MNHGPGQNTIACLGQPAIVLLCSVLLVPLIDYSTNSNSYFTGPNSILSTTLLTNTALLTTSNPNNYSTSPNSSTFY